MSLRHFTPRHPAPSQPGLSLANYCCHLHFNVCHQEPGQRHRPREKAAKPTQPFLEEARPAMSSWVPGPPGSPLLLGGGLGELVGRLPAGPCPLQAAGSAGNGKDQPQASPGCALRPTMPGARREAEQKQPGLPTLRVRVTRVKVRKRSPKRRGTGWLCCCGTDPPQRTAMKGPFLKT